MKSPVILGKKKRTFSKEYYTTTASAGNSRQQKPKHSVSTGNYPEIAGVNRHKQQAKVFHRYFESISP